MLLSDAARKLKSADASERDDALRELLAHKAEAPSALLQALEEQETHSLGAEGEARVIRVLSALLTPADVDDAQLRSAVLERSRSEHPKTRAAAAGALQVLGDAESQARLRALADDDDKAVCKAALEALLALKEAGRLAPASGSPSAGGSPSGSTAGSRQAGPDEPGEIEEGGLAVDLEKLVADHSADQGAEQAPPAPGEEGFDFERLIAEANQGAAADEGQPDPAGALRPALDQLGSPVWKTRNAAVEALVAQAKEARPFLIEKLTEPDVSGRMGAALALSRIGAPEAAGPLLMCATAAPATKEERELRPIALKALANSLTGTEEGVAEALLPLTRDDDRWVRAAALLCLGRIADRLGTRAAVIALDDDDDVVREAAAVAVSEGAREEDHELVLPLLAILGGFPSPSAEVREAILVALSRIRVSEEPVKVRLRNRVRRQVLGQTSSMRRMALSILERCYAEDDPPPIGVIDDVLSRVEDVHPEVRLLAASFVARFLEPGFTGAAAILERGALSDEPTVAQMCLDALRRHDTEAAKASLERVAQRGPGPAAERARELLEGFRPTTQEWAAAPEPAPPPALEERLPRVSAPPQRERRPDRARAEVPAEELYAPAPRRVRAVRGEDAGEVVEAKVVEPASAFTDDPGQPLAERLRTLRDAAGSGRLPAAEAGEARAAILDSFAEGGAAAAGLPARRAQLTAAWRAELLSDDEYGRLQGSLADS